MSPDLVAKVVIKHLRIEQACELTWGSADQCILTQTCMLYTYQMSETSIHTSNVGSLFTCENRAQPQEDPGEKNGVEENYDTQREVVHILVARSLVGYAEYQKGSHIKIRE